MSEPFFRRPLPYLAVTIYHVIYMYPLCNSHLHHVHAYVCFETQNENTNNFLHHIKIRMHTTLKQLTWIWYNLQFFILPQRTSATSLQQDSVMASSMLWLQCFSKHFPNSTTVSSSCIKISCMTEVSRTTPGLTASLKYRARNASRGCRSSTWATNTANGWVS